MGQLFGSPLVTDIVSRYLKVDLALWWNSGNRYRECEDVGADRIVMAQ